jgi:ectoine hydroxylase-related dioxygenase (phytanoyl-CoA dioxygenase family)
MPAVKRLSNPIRAREAQIGQQFDDLGIAAGAHVSAGYGAPIEWHQDLAFYPHTNEDLAAVGIMIDDADMENGPMMVVPGSHKGPIHDHHGPDGWFCGAMDPENCDSNLSRAVPCLGTAGSITIHHVRTVHGSATNFSGRPRRFLLYQYRPTVVPTGTSCRPIWRKSARMSAFRG